MSIAASFLLAAMGSLPAYGFYHSEREFIQISFRDGAAVQRVGRKKRCPLK